MSEGVVVGGVAKRARLVGVAESGVGAPSIKPSLKYRYGSAWFACVGNCLKVVDGVAD